MHRIDINSAKEVDLEKFLSETKSTCFSYEKVIEQEDSVAWNVWREGISSTPFVIIHYRKEGVYSILMEKLAAYSDYNLYPFLCTDLAVAAGIKPEDENIDFFELCSNEWIEDSISEEIAYLKAVLSAGYKYMFNFGIEDDYYVDTKTLKQFGVSLTSSTPRIYGYIQYSLKHKMLKKCPNLSEDYPDIEVEVPEHISIGKVKSWHTDGSQTFESYCKEDVEMLLDIGKKYMEGKRDIEGVVLNDIGTLHMEGIGVRKDYKTAASWYRRAFEQGDTLYAPSNLGDIYRKGGYGVVRNPEMAFRAYAVGDDPYAHYRVGQGLEEGWTGRQDLIAAFEWYAKAAEEGHHLALKRLRNNLSVLS